MTAAAAKVNRAGAAGASAAVQRATVSEESGIAAGTLAIEVGLADLAVNEVVPRRAAADQPPLWSMIVVCACSMSLR